MAKVTIRENGNFERALRYFKKRCQREGIFQECKDRRHYTKPSKKRREKRRNRR